jgi:osmotically-inducible protein OsmY
MSDKVLRQLVIDELDFEPSLDASHIGVSANDGIITLSGVVSSFIEKMTAERVARRVKGVRGIAQEIQVRYPSDKHNADSEIARRAVNIINWNAQVPEDSVTVKVEKGWVTLTGTVDWHYQKDAAESAVRKLSGVVGVTNLIGLKPKLAGSDVKQKILDALKRNADLEANAIRIDVVGDKVKLEGKVRAWYERDLVERAAWSVPGVHAVEDRLALA